MVYSGFDLDRFIQDYGLFRVWFRQVYTRFWFIQFGLDRFIQDSGLFRVWFRQVYTGLRFIQSLVYTGFTVITMKYWYQCHVILVPVPCNTGFLCLPLVMYVGISESYNFTDPYPGSDDRSTSGLHKPQVILTVN